VTASRGHFDGAVRPVIFGVVVVLAVGFTWEYWYIALPVIALILIGIGWVIRRDRLRHGLSPWPWTDSRQ
jgi:hypothetical protein